MQDNKEILDKLTELFLSKGRVLTRDMAVVWVEKLSNLYDKDILLEAIDRLILKDEDFPTIAKISDIAKGLKKEEWIQKQLHESVYWPELGYEGKDRLQIKDAENA